MWSRTTGLNFQPGAFLLRALAAVLLTWFGLLWLAGQVFTRLVLSPLCLPAAPAPAGFEPVEITVQDGYHLRGWWRQPENGAVILMMGGIGANRSAMLPEAEWLAENGFGLLLLENRNCQGGGITLGFREGQDFLAMMDFARQRSDVTRFGALGFSAGSAAAIRAAALSPDIQAVVSEGGYADLADLLSPSDSQPFTVEGQMQAILMAAFWQQLGFWPGLLDSRADLAKIVPRPVLLIYGEHELNRAQAGEMLAAAGPNARLWIAKGVSHGEYARMEPERYKSLLLDFFSQLTAERR